MKRSELTVELYTVEISKKDPTIELWASANKQYRILSIYQSDDDTKIYIDIEEIK